MSLTHNSPLMNTYNRQNVRFARGDGIWLWDDHFQKYMDAISGIAVTNLGHSNPNISAAISQQASRVMHTSNLYHIDIQEELGEKLTVLAGMDKVFFCNSGTEANEAAIKLARLYGHQKGIELPTIVVMQNAFHGRTMAALTATDNEKIKQGFGPFLDGFVRVPFNDLPALEAVFAQNPNIVAVLAEPVQGEGGVIPATQAWMQGVRALCDRYDALLMLDEIQTGMGRTGSMFAYQQFGILPDVMSLAKALGNGFPIGAMLARGKAAEVFAPGNHGTTFGGNYMACAAALAVLGVFERRPELIENARSFGQYLHKRFETELADLPQIKAVRSMGLMIGIQLDRPCGELVQMALNKHHLLINVTRGDTIRLLPPLTLDTQEAITLFDGVVDTIREFLKTSQ